MLQSRVADNSHVLARIDYAGRERELVALVVVSVLSLVAVVGLLAALGVAAWNTRLSRSRNFFFRTNVAAYFTALLFSNMLLAVSSTMNVRWIELSAAEIGPYCSAQGAIKHVAHVSSALWTLVIAIHTFYLLFLESQPPRWVMYMFLVGVTTIVFLLALLGPIIYQDGPEFYTTSGLWPGCWINDYYGTPQLAMDYLLLFTSAVLSFLLHTLVLLRRRGNILVVERSVRFRLNPKSEWRGRELDERALSVAKQMLLYPVAYTFLILPMATARILEWTGHKVSFEVRVFSDAVFLLSGVVNVILFAITCGRVLPPRALLGRLAIPHPHVLTLGQSDSEATAATSESFDIHAASAPAEARGFQSPVSPLASTRRYDISFPTEARLSDYSTKTSSAAYGVEDTRHSQQAHQGSQSPISATAATSPLKRTVASESRWIPQKPMLSICEPFVCPGEEADDRDERIHWMNTAGVPHLQGPFLPPVHASRTCT